MKWRDQDDRIDRIDRCSQLHTAMSHSHSVKIGLGRAREVKVDNDIDGLDIDTSSEEIFGQHRSS